MYVYLELVEEGELTSPQDVLSLEALEKMNNEKYYVCSGICNYTTYKQSIGFDPTKVFGVLVPSDTVRHVDCERLCMKLDNQNSLVCESCISLKYYLAKQI
jgi:hypothetical protein